MPMLEAFQYIALGIFGMVASTITWGSFQHTAVGLMGRRGARVIYFLLGLVVFGVGIGMLTGWIPEQI